MTQSKRTKPLDRDGDGKNGGSLPGNKTAPYATPEGDPNHPDDGPPNADATPPEQPPIEGETQSWARDDARLIQKLQAIDAALDPNFTDAQLADEIDCWTDGEAQAAELFADQMAAEGRYQDDAGDERNADGSPIELPHMLGRFLIGEQAARDAASEPDPTEPTFSPEEVAAGQTPVIEQEGETVATAADQAVTIDDADPLIALVTDTAPIAVRRRELQLLVTSRRLYKSAEGYSATYGAPYVDEETVQAWIHAGLAQDEPTAGNWGGVRVTPEARRVLAAPRMGEAA